MYTNIKVVCKEEKERVEMGGKHILDREFNVFSKNKHA